jgi:hypothetical protein
MAVKGPGRSRASRRESSLKTTPTSLFLGLLVNFATGPFGVAYRAGEDVRAPAGASRINA